MGNWSEHISIPLIFGAIIEDFNGLKGHFDFYNPFYNGCVLYRMFRVRVVDIKDS